MESAPDERAPKRQTIENRAYIAIQVKTAGVVKVRSRVNCEEEFKLMSSIGQGQRQRQG
jgi:hypothetical protein